MAALEPPSSPAGGDATTAGSLAWYKSQYEQLETELAEFRGSSEELEKELEKDLDAAEKRENTLREKAEGLSFEVDEWKVRWVHRLRRCAMADCCLHRGNTRSQRRKRMLHRILSRRRLRL